MSSSSPPRMKALILVGGYGTRLRPLTFSTPKPLVPFSNFPIVVHQIEALVKVGVKDVVLAVNVQPAVLLEFMKKCEQKYGITCTCSQEDVPLGTAGPLALARKLLDKDPAPFFMFNSDVICDFPLAEMLKFHQAHGGEGTILVTEVKDPSKYGVVLSAENGCIQSFIEKPTTFVSNKINAGIYLFNTTILSRIELKPTSIEREIFPRMAADHQLYSMVLKGYWMDIGQPKDYLSGQVLHLAYVKKTHPEQLVKEGRVESSSLSSAHLAKDVTIIGNVLLHPDAKIGNGSVIGPDVVVGPNVVIGENARIKRSALLEGVVVKSSAFVNSSIVGWHSTVGSWAHVSESVLGEDVQIANEVSVQHLTVCPHKGVGESSFEPKVLL